MHKQCPVCSLIDEHPADGFWWMCSDCGTRFRQVAAIDADARTYPKPYRKLIEQRDELLTLCDDIVAGGFNETDRLSWASEFVARLEAIKAKGQS